MIESTVVLGATGSIGVNTLALCERYDIRVEALSAGKNIALLNEQISRFNPRYVCISDLADKPNVAHDRIFVGQEGLSEMLTLTQSEHVVNAIVGYAGLRPTLQAQQSGKQIALANKESLVIAGAFIDTSRITPIDSEHFGLWYLLDHKPFRHLVITASGGAFRDWDIEDMRHASYQDALKHPNWSMGDKITIDSATMTNKLFELLEARWLFDTENVDALIERDSIVHALIEFQDGSTTAHFAKADMKLPIAFALGIQPDSAIIDPVDLLAINLRFEPISTERYPIWQLKPHLMAHPHLGVVLNAANETAIEKFRKGECSFFEMSKIVLDAYKKFEDVKPNDIEDIITIDKEVRAYAKQ